MGQQIDEESPEGQYQNMQMNEMIQQNMMADPNQQIDYQGEQEQIVEGEEDMGEDGMIDDPSGFEGAGEEMMGEGEEMLGEGEDMMGMGEEMLGEGEEMMGEGEDQMMTQEEYMYQMEQLKQLQMMNEMQQQQQYD